MIANLVVWYRSGTFFHPGSVARKYSSSPEFPKSISTKLLAFDFMHHTESILPLAKVESASWPGWQLALVSQLGAHLEVTR